MASITCKAGGTKHTHDSVEAVRRHFLGGTWACDWLLRGFNDEDGEPYTFECGAPAWELPDGRGHTCEAGHEHLTLETQHREGRHYAEDAFDAAVIERGGGEWMPMGRDTDIDPAEVAHIHRTHTFAR